MADQTPQNFDNHVMLPKTGFIAAGIMLAGVISAIVGLFNITSTAGLCLIGTGVVVGGFGAIFALGVSRRNSTKLQDRVIRIEMRLRLAEILPADLQGTIASLTIPQLVGLRFASDGEMPELVRKVVAESIDDRTEIKKLVRDWQGDYDRV
jgi:hypothetical protein